MDDTNPFPLNSSNSNPDHVFVDEQNLFGDAMEWNFSVPDDLGDFEIPSEDLDLSSLFQTSDDDDVVVNHGDSQIPSSSFGVPPFSNLDHGQGFVSNNPNQVGLNNNLDDPSQGLVQTGFQSPFDLITNDNNNHGGGVVVPDSFAPNNFEGFQYNNNIGNFVQNNPPNNPFGYGFVDNNNNNSFVIPSMEGLLQNQSSFQGFNDNNINNSFVIPSMEGLVQNQSSFQGFNDNDNNNPMMMTNNVVDPQSGVNNFPYSYGLAVAPYTNNNQPENFETQIILSDPFLSKIIELDIPSPAPLPEIGLGRRLIPYPIELLEDMLPPPLALPPATVGEPSDMAVDAPPSNPAGQMGQDGDMAVDAPPLSNRGKMVVQDGGDDGASGSGSGGGSGDGGDTGPIEKLGLVFYFDEQLEKLSLSNDAPRERIVVARINTPEVLEAIERDDPDLYERMYKTWDSRKRKNSPSPDLDDLPPEKRGGDGGAGPSSTGNDHFQNAGINIGGSAGPSSTGNNDFQNAGINIGGGGTMAGGFYHP